MSLLSAWKLVHSPFDLFEIIGIYKVGPNHRTLRVLIFLNKILYLVYFLLFYNWFYMVACRQMSLKKFCIQSTFSQQIGE